MTVVFGLGVVVGAAVGVLVGYALSSWSDRHGLRRLIREIEAVEAARASTA